jgi:hypothetical protein
MTRTGAPESWLIPRLFLGGWLALCGPTSGAVICLCAGLAGLRTPSALAVLFFAGAAGGFLGGAALAPRIFPGAIRYSLWRRALAGPSGIGVAMVTGQILAAAGLADGPAWAGVLPMVAEALLTTTVFGAMVAGAILALGRGAARGTGPSA